MSLLLSLSLIFFHFLLGREHERGGGTAALYGRGGTAAGFGGAGRDTARQGVGNPWQRVGIL
jgi:hypothetical protein